MEASIEKTKKCVEPILDSLGFYLDRIEFKHEGDGDYLRVYIDKKGGISIDDCVEVSDQLSEKLDELNPDPFPDPYFLEVSSPGAERPLQSETDFEHAVGEYVHVSLYQKIDGKKAFEGHLKKVSDSELTLAVKDKTMVNEVKIPRDKISKARLAIEF